MNRLVALTLCLSVACGPVQAGRRGATNPAPVGTETGKYGAEKPITAESLMVWLTGALVFVGIAQAGLFWWQLRLIRKSLVDTKVSADAARDSAKAATQGVELSRATVEVQLRAYISMREFEVTPVYEAGQKLRIQEWRVAPRIVNAGQTPARIVAFRVNFITRDDGLPDDFGFGDIDADTEPSTGTIGNGGSLAGASFRVNRGIIMTVGLGQERAFIFGHIDYRDVFLDTPTRRTDFAAEMFVNGDPFDHEPEKLSFRFLGRYNDAT